MALVTHHNNYEPNQSRLIQMPIHSQRDHHQHNRLQNKHICSGTNMDQCLCLGLHNQCRTPSTIPSPKCVQRPRNIKNDMGPKTDVRYRGGSESQHVRERTCSQYLDSDYTRTLSEDHYQHYYSYYYSLKAQKFPHKQHRGRKLPTTHNMPLQAKDLMSALSERFDSEELKNNVLMEKPVNNWDWDSDSFQVISGPGPYSNEIEANELKTGKYYESIENKKETQGTMISQFSLNSDKEVRNLRNNNYEDLKDHQFDSDESDDSPLKFPASLALKKNLSPRKSRRVFIYKNQSPRSSQVLSQRRPHRSRTNLQTEPKKDNDSKKSTEARDRVLEPHSPILIGNKFENKNEKRFYEDSDSDADVDNVSDFEESGDSDVSSDSEECYRSQAFKLTNLLDVVSTSVSDMSSSNSTESMCNPESLLVPSLFPNVPPYIAFSSSTKKGPDVPADLYRILKWRVTSVMPRVVRTVLANSGMRLLKKTNDWMGVWGKHMKSPCFKTVRPYQKFNHLPGSFKIGRKDSCWRNLVKQMAKHGKKEFGFMPKTFIMPNDLKQLRKCWPKFSKKNVKWIIKPPASARGSGIKVVDRWTHIPKRKSIIVQKYIERPLLINGSKFDLRLYVLVTSIHPLRVFMYHNGLARFASVKYSDKSDTLNDRCMHLTNYSINKFSSNYSKNEDVNACHGHKWTIKSLWNYLANRGVRTELLWEALTSLVLRTILAGEISLHNVMRTNVESKYNCFELFGFDVLLDSELIPWLLEVNISPSLHSELPLDAHVKAPLVQSVLNTALYNIPPKVSIERQKEIAAEMSLTPGPICYDKRLYVNYLSRAEKLKHSTYTRKTMEDRDEYIKSILEHLTPDDVRCLIITEDELARSSPLERIFPTANTHTYLKYTETPRYYNRLLDAWETRYGQNREEGIALLRQLCDKGYHLEVPQIPTEKPLNYSATELPTDFIFKN